MKNSIEAKNKEFINKKNILNININENNLVKENEIHEIKKNVNINDFNENKNNKEKRSTKNFEYELIYFFN